MKINNLSKDVAEAAAEEGIKIYTIGVGTEKGGPIPIKRNGVVAKYKKDSDEKCHYKTNSQTLKEIFVFVAAYMLMEKHD